MVNKALSARFYAFAGILPNVYSDKSEEVLALECSLQDATGDASIQRGTQS